MRVDIISMFSQQEHIIPEYKSGGSAGVDLRAFFGDVDDTILLSPGESRMISLGIKISGLPKNVMAMIVPRSGLGSLGIKLDPHGGGGGGIVLTNNVGVIDSDYQGMLMVPIINNTTTPFAISHGDRIVQMVFIPVINDVTFNLVDEFSVATERGESGFGGTGVK